MFGMKNVPFQGDTNDLKRGPGGYIVIHPFPNRRMRRHGYLSSGPVPTWVPGTVTRGKKKGPRGHLHGESISNYRRMRHGV